MMFYRTDILEELGVSVPETWDDLIEISSVLANNNRNRRFVRREYLSYYAYAGGN
ncbi:MAG: extracellular solute-binding protein [Oscillospiraceae bacterium]